MHSEGGVVSWAGAVAPQIMIQRFGAREKLTVAVDRTVCAWLLAVALDLFAPALVARSCDTAALLHGDRGRVARFILDVVLKFIGY